ncbi:MAG: PorV/PorQ family protein, partial [bacterium]
MMTRSVFALILAAEAAQATGGAGVAAGEFLNIGANTRAAGMGEAYVGVADDVGSLYYNPAGLVRRREMSFHYLHAAWLGDLGYDHVAGVFPQARWGAFGAGFTRLFFSGDKITVGPSGEPVTGGEFQAGSLAASASYAVQIAAPTSLGATLKFLSQDLDGVRGSAVAADAGMIYRSPLPALTMGAQLANLGTRVNAATLPVVLKLGAGMSLPAVRGLASLAGKKGMWDLPLLAADVHFQ